MFTLVQKSKLSQARLGRFITSRGEVETPFFLPIATRGAVKSLDMADLNTLGPEMILANTYHLWLKPGLDLITQAGDLHKFIGWSKPILTDSGGFQVFSLSKMRKLTDSGVEFVVPESGTKYFLSPIKALDIQVVLGSDVAMVLDECIGYPAEEDLAREAVIRTSLWAKQQLEYWPQVKKSAQNLFAIVQGSVFRHLREQSAAELTTLPFDGYAIGGLAVGEEPDKMYAVLDYTAPLLPEEKIKYLMGVGYPENIVEAVRRGIDCFDCVIPTREARHGRLYVFNPMLRRNQEEFLDLFGGHEFYDTINIERSDCRNDLSLIDFGCGCQVCKDLKISRAYLHHLFDIKEGVAERLATIHNLHFYLELMKLIRQAIRVGKL